MTTATETITLRSVNDREQLLTGLQNAQTERIDATAPTGRGALARLHYECRGQAVPSEIALPGHHLAFADEDGAEQLIEIGPDLIHIGRSSSADIRIEDVYVSRRQAIVTRREDTVRLLDDGSSGGTFVNGKSTVAANLADGDVISVGSVSFRYVVVH